MSTTITRPTVTDDDGSGTTGTVWNNTWHQGFCDAIDALFSGALSVGGALTVGGGQVVFPAVQSASANANTLDDYEEGTWTPVIGGSGGTSGQTYATQTGSYVKIGQLVMAHFLVTLSTKGTITTSVQIQGLPFTSAGAQSVASLQFISLATNWVSVLASLATGATAASVIGLSAAAASATALATADIANNTTLAGTIIYRASA